jgi:tetratricopeptide (TPR) repeat protein
MPYFHSGIRITGVTKTFEIGNSDSFRNILIIGVFFLLGGAIYSNTLYSPFVFDDGPSITRNPTIKDMNNFFGSSTGYHKYPTRYVGYITFALNYHFGGLDPFWYHVVNLLIHIANAVLLYYVLRATFRVPFLQRAVSEEISRMVSTTAGILFLVHPVQTEAVTFIVQRVTSLTAMFCLFSMLFYIKSMLLLPDFKIKSYLYYGLSVIFCVCAMKTKEISLVFPAVLILYECLFFDKKIKQRVFLLLPYCVTLLIIPVSLVNFNAPVEKVLADVGTITRVQTDMSRWDYLLTQISVVATYIRLLLLPIDQNLDYDYPIYHSLFHSRVFLSAILLLSIVGIAVWSYLRSRRGESAGLRVISFGILWFFITLSVESSVMPIVDVIFEHRLYLPSAGAFISFATAMSLVPRRWKRRTLAGALILVVGTLCIATYNRNETWKDDLTLWSDTVKKSPLKARPHYNLGNSYNSRGKMKEAVKEYQAAIHINPDYADAYLNLGVAYASLGVEDGAEGALKKAIQLQPSDAEAYYNLGLLYANRNLHNLAIEQYSKAISLNPDSAKIHNNFGIALAEMGRLDEAISQFQLGFRFHPEDQELRKNLEHALSLKSVTDR